MAGAIRELNKSRAQETTLSSFEHARIYSVAGYTRAELYALTGFTDPIGGFSDEDLVEGAAQATAPDTIAGATRQTVGLKPIDDFAGDAWVIEFGYQSGETPGGSGPPAVEGESSYSFDAGSAQITLQRSLSTTTHVKSGEPTPPDFKNGVQYDRKEDRFAGAEVVIPTFGFGETHYLPSTFGSQADIAAIFGLVGKTNLTPFRGFAADEVLFLGASGSKRGSGLWEVTYRFEAAPNVASLSIGDITGIAKKGWEYLWVLHAEGSGTGPSFVAPDPEAVYVEQMYGSSNFSTLGIGTA